GKRDASPRLGLSVELLVPDLAYFIRHLLNLRSEALGVDVHNGSEAGAAHRGCGGSEETRSAGSQPTRFVRLRDELGAVFAAQAEERRRAEQLAVVPVEPGTQLLEERQPRALGRRGDEHAHEVAEGRVAELAAPLELVGEEARHVVARRERQRPRVGLEGLYEHAPRRI